MKKLRVFSALFLTFVIVLSFSGCSFRMSSFESLLRPPKPTGNYAELQSAFEKIAGSGYTLCTPDNGDFQSAFIPYDCDSDGDEDAVVFYHTADEPDVVKMLFFFNKDGKWVPDTVYDGFGSAVDTVMFPDINHDDIHEILVGWSVLSGKANKTFSVYSITSGKVVPVKSYPYTYISNIDVNGDGLDDIFTLTVDSSVPEILTGYARVYNFNSQNSSLTVLSETRTDGNISAYTSVKTETVDDVNYIYVEASKGEHESITELIYWDDETSSLVSPFFDSESQTTKLTWRNSQLTCTDIDGDGFLEIPMSVEMKGSSSINTKVNHDTSAENTLSESMYYIKWVKYRDGDTRAVQYSIYNESGYLLNIQSSWVGRITVIRADSQIDIYRWISGSNEIGDLLCSICSYDNTDEENRKTYESYTQLKSVGNTNYVYRITDEGYYFGVKDKNLENEFVLTDFGGTK